MAVKQFGSKQMLHLLPAGEPVVCTMVLCHRNDTMLSELKVSVTSLPVAVLLRVGVYKTNFSFRTVFLKGCKDIFENKIISKVEKIFRRFKKIFCKKFSIKVCVKFEYLTLLYSKFC